MNDLALRKTLTHFSLLILLLLQGLSAFAQSDPNAKTEELLNRQTNFTNPNEYFPQDAKRLYALAPEGVHLSVGTERSLMGFAMNTNSTHLVMADNMEVVNRYNRANLILIDIATSRQDYLDLRLNMSLEDIKLRMYKHAGRYTQAEYFELVKEFIEIVRGEEYNRHFHMDPTGRWISRPFQGANYLFYDRHFNRIQSAVHEGRVSVIQADLNTTEGIQAIKEAITNTGQKLSLLDLSNIIESRSTYTTYELTQRFLNAIAAHTSNKSLVVTSSVGGLTYVPRRIFELLDFSRRLTHDRRITWIMEAFTFDHLRSLYNDRADWLLHDYERAKPGQVNRRNYLLHVVTEPLRRYFRSCKALF